MKFVGVKTVLLMSVLVAFMGCNKPKWQQTLEGHYYYDKTQSGYQYSWQGQCFGDLVHGKGTMVIYDKEGAEIEKKKMETYYGANTQWPYLPIKDGKFLGETNKNNEPNGFGVLMKDDEIAIGSFRKGKLDKGMTKIYKIDKKGKAVPIYTGSIKKGLYDGGGELYQNGDMVYSGWWRKGVKNGLGKEYEDSKLVYDGAFKNGERSGNGKEYRSGNLVYEGEWKQGKYDGEGTSFRESGVVWYEGGWKNGLYHGKGKLYENGKCLEGKWKDGRNEKEISVTAFEQVRRTTKQWFGKGEEEVQDGNPLDEEIEMAESEQEFVESLSSDLNEYLESELKTRVDKRFGFWHIFRMCLQPIFRSDLKRADFAQDFFVKNVTSKKMETFINVKIDNYNSHTSGNKLHYVEINDIPKNAIVNSDVAIKVFDREALETADIVSDILVTILIVWIVGFIIGFIIGLIIQDEEVFIYAGIIDLALGIVAFVLGLCISVFHQGPMATQMENAIAQMLVDNYLSFLDSQYIIEQMLGLL